MYECNIIEAEDFGFNHFIHHIDDYEEPYFDCNEELTIDEDILWD